MDTSKIAENLKQSIIKNHLNDFNFKLNELISFCDSEIEKLLLLQFFNYFQSYGYDIREDLNKFSKIEFIDEYIDADFEQQNLSNLEKNYLQDKIERYKYKYDNQPDGYIKYCGFKVTINTITISKVKEKYDGCFLELAFKPQTYTIIGNKYFRIDLALFCNIIDFYSSKVIETKKIAIECDGFDYHSSREQFTNDKIRERALLSSGWNSVLRYSGSEIYSINNNLEKINLNIEQIIKILKS